MTGSVSRHQRFTAHRECPVCQGHSGRPSHRGERDHGFISHDGLYAHCSREEFAGQLQPGRDGLYAHFLGGTCRCGTAHAAASRLDRPRPTRIERLHEDADRTLAALRIWEQTRPAAGTLAETYLRSRAIRVPLPATLRFDGALPHAKARRWFPALVAGVERWGLQIPVAIHRTYLAPDGSGKAAVEPSRMALGPIAGGAVRCGPAAPEIAVTEGIETALSLQQATGIPTWAVLGASNLANLILPPLPLAARVLIGSDPDPVGRAAANRATRLWSAQGREVRIATPPDGKDFNDLLREQTLR